MRRRARLGTLLVLISLILSVVFAFVPSAFNSSTIAWTPDSSSDSGSLQLTRGAPERMSIQTTCELARTRTADDPSMLDTGSLGLSVVDGEVRLQSSPDGPAAEVSLPPGDCEILATYTHDGSGLELSVGDDRDEVAVAAPKIFGLYTSDPPSVTSVDITTQETGLAPSWGRWTIGLVALAFLLVGTVLLWLPTRRPRDERRGWKAFVPRLAPVDGFVTICVVGLALITPPLIDDGWYLGRTSVLQQRWWFGNVYATEDAWLPQGALHELVLSALQAADLELAHLRIGVALLLGLTWVVLRRGVLAPAVGEKASRWPPAAATYVAFAGAYLITVRQEPVVLFFGVLALTVAISEERSTRPVLVFAGLLAAGMAVTTHQTGWVAAAPAAMILWSVGLELRCDRSRWLGLGTAVVAATAGVVLIAFAAADIHTVLEGARTFSDELHGYGPLDELLRYQFLFYGQAARVFAVCLLLVWCVAGSRGVTSNDSGPRRLWILSALWLCGLLATSSKLEWHLGVYAFPAIGLATLAGVGLRERDRASGLGTSAVLFLVTMAAGISMSSPGAWNFGDLSSRTWPELSSLLLGDTGRVFWYVGIVVLLVVGVLADQRGGGWQPAALTGLCLAVLFPLGASLTWLAVDAAEPEWSATGANLRQLTDRNTCGPLDGMDFDADVVALASRPERGEHPQLASEGFPRTNRLSTGPLSEVPTWGTWASDDPSTSADARTGLFQTPSFPIADAQEITIWSASGSRDSLKADVVFTSSSGAESTTEIVVDAEPRWARLHLTVPAEATEVRVDVEDQNAGFGGWLAVSAPVVSSGNPLSAIRGSTGYANPLASTLLPCLQLPDLSNGYWDRVDYITNDGTGFDVNALRGLTVTDVGCRPGSHCLRKIDYPMADVEVTPTP